MTEPAPSPKPTLGTPSAWVVLLLVTALGIAADLISKSIAFERIADYPVTVDRRAVIEAGATGPLDRLIPPHDAVVVVPRILELKLVLNRSAVFGIGAGKRWFFVGFTMIAVGFAMYMFAKWTKPRDRAAHAALGLLLSGGLGNLYDRVVHGCVRDFLHPLPAATWPFGWSSPWSGREVWPYVSNVADALLLIGIAMLMWHTWRSGPKK